MAIKYNLYNLKNGLTEEQRKFMLTYTLQFLDAHKLTNSKFFNEIICKNGIIYSCTPLMICIEFYDSYDAINTFSPYFYKITIYQTSLEDEQVYGFEISSFNTGNVEDAKVLKTELEEWETNFINIWKNYYATNSTIMQSRESTCDTFVQVYLKALNRNLIKYKIRRFFKQWF